MKSNQARAVYIDIETAGTNFATYAVVRDRKTRRKLHETDVVPYRFNDAALRLAESWIRDKGHFISLRTDGE